MNHTVKKLSDTKVQILITLSSEDLNEAKQTVLGVLAKDIKVDGFRKGKAPASVVEKNLNSNLLANEVTERAVDNALNEVITVEELRVLDQPKIELKKFVPFSEMEFEAVVEVIPQITLGNYHKLKVKRRVEKVETKDVDEVVDRLRQNLSVKKPVDRPAKTSDEAVIDFTGKKDGVAFDGGTSKDYPLVLGSASFIPGFESAIVGHKAGDKFDVPLTFPKDYHSAELKGAKVVFEVELKKVNEVELPELDTEFAKKIGPFETIDDLKADIRHELTVQKDRQADEKYKDDLLGALVAVSQVPVPQVLVDDQIKSLEQDSQQNMAYRGLTTEQYLKQAGFNDLDDWREKELKPTAIRRVQSGLVLAELSKVENVTATKQQLEERHTEMLAQYPNMKEQLDTPEARRDLANRVLTENTLERLVELNS